MHYIVKHWKKAGRAVCALLLFVGITAIIVSSGSMASAAEPERPVLIIDPGHGGLDGGAVSVSGIPESGINLDISLKMLEISKLFGIEAVMTRNSEQLDYPDDSISIREKKTWDQKNRAAFINGFPNAVLLSIHMNQYPDPRPSGTQAFFGRAVGSRELGTLIHNNLILYLCPENRRVAVPISEKLYLYRSVSCPTVLVECGFLSNKADAERLTDLSYQKTLAAVIVASYLQYEQQK